MPEFSYEALTDAGTPTRGVLSAANSEDAISKIRQLGLFPTSVREAKKREKQKESREEKANRKNESKYERLYDEEKSNTGVYIFIGLIFAIATFFLGILVGRGI